MRFFRERRRKRLQSDLDEASRLTEEGWTTDDCNTGIVYKLTENPPILKRVSVEVFMLIKAITRGIGTKAKWDREKDGLRMVIDSSMEPGTFEFRDSQSGKVLARVNSK